MTPFLPAIRCSRWFYLQNLMNDNKKLPAPETASLHPPKNTLIVRTAAWKGDGAESQQPCDTQHSHPDAPHVNT